MKRIRTIAAVLLTLTGVLAGCDNKNQPGETVPAPPRDLIEKSYRGAKGVNPPPVAPGTNARP